MRKPKITLYTLNVNGNYAPKITEVTYPYLRHYAEKIGAEFYVMTERKFPDWPAGVEKFQVYDLARERGDEWSYFFDGDALIHPDMFPLHPLVGKDTVMHNSSDFAPHRWSYDDPYLLRDGRRIGSCNWFAMFSEWCRDMYHPPEGITPEEAIAAIHPVHVEEERSITAAHLCDDYLCSRNIARYGLKFATVRGIYEKMGAKDHGHFFHDFLIPEALKPQALQAKLGEWGVLPVPKIEKLPPEIEAILNGPSRTNSAVEKALGIYGWMEPPELEWLAAQAKTRRRIAEIGSFMGRSTMALSQTPGAVLAIDTWQGSEEHQEMLKQHGPEWLFEQFSINLRQEIVSRKVLPVRMSSADAAKKFDGDQFDMVFIDGAHDYESVRQDIQAWWPRLMNGGILCGHDYGNGTSEGLERAVREFVPNFQKIPNGSIWYVMVN